MYCRSSLLLPLAWSALHLSGTAAQDYPTCLSYGIDFVGGGSYFLNSQSSDPFTSVTQFSGCQNDTANILLVNDYTSDEYTCSDIPLQPDGKPELSTCDIDKNQMASGDWSLLIISNNGNADPIAYERDFYVEVATQATYTATPTLSFNQTITPTITSFSTSTVYNTTTIQNSKTITIPAATKYVTVTPPPTTSVKTIALTRTLKTWTRTAIITTRTATATCYVPPRPHQPDPTCRIRPKNIRLPPGINIPGNGRRWTQKREDRALNYKSAVKRFEAVRARRAVQIDERDIVKRSADAPTITFTQTTLTVSATAIFTAPPFTEPAVVVLVKTITTTLPPVTIKTGVARATKTAPRQTKTVVQVTTKYIWQTKTMTASFTKWTTVTPSASIKVCKSQGGHFGHGW